MTMLEQVLRYLNNFFVERSIGGTEVLQNGVVVNDATGFIVGQYIYLKDSLLSDGLYTIEAITGTTLTLSLTEDLKPETAAIRVYGLMIPKQVIALSEEIATANASNPSGLVQERLGDYSVTYGYSDTASWISRYKTRLAPWRKVFLVWP
jgi:hypothetical protein